MRRQLILVALLAVLPLPAQPKKKPRRAPLPTRVERLIAASPALARAHVGVRLVSLDGREIFSLNPRHWFVPASNTKLFSTALALTRLGPNFRYSTRLTAEAEPDDTGVLHGDLRLVGAGDPSLSGRAYPYDKENEWADDAPAIDDLAAQLARRGVKRIDGAVIGDDTAYIWEPFPNGWGIDDPLWEYGAPVSALTLQDNSFRLEVRPGPEPGDPAEVLISPDVGQLTLVPSVVTVPYNERGRLHVDRLANTRELRVYGTITVGAKPYTTLLAVEDPAQYAAQALTAALERHGIAVRDPARALHRTGPEDLGPAGPVLVAERLSPPLSDLVKIVNKVSQNLHAELLLLEVSRQGKPYGSRQAGIEELRAFLAEKAGLAKEDVNFEDGSGLSRLTLLTPEATTNLLVYMASTEAKDVFLQSLPIGGEDGTLKRRFSGWAGAGRVHAKTGSLTHVSALGGYIEDPVRGLLAFSVMVNNANAPAFEIRAGIDKLVKELLE